MSMVIFLSYRNLNRSEIMTTVTPRLKLLQIPSKVPLPRPLRKPHEQVAKELNQNGFGDFIMDGNCILSLREESVINLDEVEPMDIDIKSEIDENENNQEFRKEYMKTTEEEIVSEYRKIVIDGLNICHEYSKHLNRAVFNPATGVKFSVEGLNIVYEYLKKRGYKDEKIIIIMKKIPQRFTYEREIIQNLEDKNMLYYVPSRRSGHSYIQSDDDLFLLKTAKILDAIVLSNDQFQKEKKSHPEYSDVIEKFVIQPRFISGKLILPDDPLGKNGPKLEEFLRSPKL